MPHRILSAQQRYEELDGLCALTVMAKAPRPGRVKTRLNPPLSLEQCAAINSCFLRDTTENIAAITRTHPCAGVISYTPQGDESLYAGIVPQEFTLVLQRGDAFGERLLAAAQDVLACGYSAVCLIDSDSPTVPAAAFEEAVDLLTAPGDRIVLGGSQDGGYYLIGMKQPHAAPFENITWSTGTVLEETRERIRSAGIDLVELPLWYDVDDAATLAVLEEELLHGKRPPFAEIDGYTAPSTKEFLLQRKGG